jgi:hypothetical protein
MACFKIMLKPLAGYNGHQCMLENSCISNGDEVRRSSTRIMWCSKLNKWKDPLSIRENPLTPLPVPPNSKDQKSSIKENKYRCIQRYQEITNKKRSIINSVYLLNMYRTQAAIHMPCRRMHPEIIGCSMVARARRTSPRPMEPPGRKLIKYHKRATN